MFNTCKYVIIICVYKIIKIRINKKNYEFSLILKYTNKKFNWNYKTFTIGVVDDDIGNRLFKIYFDALLIYKTFYLHIIYPKPLTL